MKRYLFALIVIVGCSDDKEESLDRVPEELYSNHVESFYQEVEERGISIERKDLTVVWGNPPACGDRTYGYSSSSGNRITITSAFKVFENDSEFGGIIFREMAHLLLDKDYVTQAEVDGCFQIMYPCADTSNFELEMEDAMDCLLL